MQPFDNLRLQSYNDNYQSITIATDLLAKRRKQAEVTPELARSILSLSYKKIRDIKAKLGCTAEQVRAIFDREMYWRELLEMPKTQKPRSVRKTMPKPKYTDEQREEARILAKEVGLHEASKRTGIPYSTVRDLAGGSGGVNNATHSTV